MDPLSYIFLLASAAISNTNLFCVRCIHRSFYSLLPTYCPPIITRNCHLYSTLLSSMTKSIDESIMRSREIKKARATGNNGNYVISNGETTQGPFSPPLIPIDRAQRDGRAPRSWSTVTRQTTPNSGRYCASGSSVRVDPRSSPGYRAANWITGIDTASHPGKGLTSRARAVFIFTGGSFSAK